MCGRLKPRSWTATAAINRYASLVLPWFDSCNLEHYEAAGPTIRATLRLFNDHRRIPSDNGLLRFIHAFFFNEHDALFVRALFAAPHPRIVPGRSFYTVRSVGVFSSFVLSADIGSRRKCTPCDRSNGALSNGVTRSLRGFFPVYSFKAAGLQENSKRSN